MMPAINFRFYLYSLLGLAVTWLLVVKLPWILQKLRLHKHVDKNATSLIYAALIVYALIVFIVQPIASFAYKPPLDLPF